MNGRDLRIEDFSYELPAARIADRPAEPRDSSRLLVYEKGNISETIFSALADQLPASSLLVFNNSKVIRARLLFTTITGATVEIFCLEPAAAVSNYAEEMQRTREAIWLCMVGNAAKWRDEFLETDIKVAGTHILLRVKQLEKLSDARVLQFSWNSDHGFGEIIEAAGHMPLPPYIKREDDRRDASAYQTMFAAHEGSVAAPTATLHFTPAVMQRLENKGIAHTHITLHVGAGTFKPVKAETMQGHEMHAEYISVTKGSLEKLLSAKGPVCAGGTTSLRTLESVYWLGVKVVRGLDPTTGISQWEVYEQSFAAETLTRVDALTALLNYLKEKNLDNLFTRTQILIVPGYKFRMADMLITNFHQPRSTLLLLVAAAIGDDWKQVYDYALQNNFRFLSYGDASLLSVQH